MDAPHSAGRAGHVIGEGRGGEGRGGGLEGGQLQRSSANQRDVLQVSVSKREQWAAVHAAADSGRDDLVQA